MVIGGPTGAACSVGSFNCSPEHESAVESLPTSPPTWPPHSGGRTHGGGRTAAGLHRQKCDDVPWIVFPHQTLLAAQTAGQSADRVHIANAGTDRWRFGALARVYFTEHRITFERLCCYKPSTQDVNVQSTEGKHVLQNGPALSEHIPDCVVFHVADSRI